MSDKFEDLCAELRALEAEAAAGRVVMAAARVWFLQRVIWPLKWQWGVHVSIPFWDRTRGVRAKLGIHHFSDDAVGDC